MAILNKLQLIADITGNIYTNTLRAIKGNTVKARLLNIVDSTLVRIYDTSTNFTTNNPILKSGEIGIESNTLSTSPKFKIGDGVTAWNSLPYAAASSQTLEQVVTNGGIVTGSDNTTVIFEIDKSNDLINVKTPTYFHDNPVILGEAVAKVVTLDVANRIVSSGINVSDIATKAYAEGLVAGLLDDRGSYDASTNTFPSTGGSGTSGAILKGDFWYISVAGTLGGQAVTIGDSVRALVDAPAQTSSNWSVLETNIGYVPENVSNKATTMTGNTTSNIVYLTAKAIYDWVLSKITVNPKSVVFGSSTGELTSDPKVFVDQYKCLVIGGNGYDSGRHEVANPKPQIELVSDNENVQAFNMKTYGPLGGYPTGPETQNDLHFYRYDGTQANPTNTKKDMFLMSAGFRGWGTTLPTQSSVAIQVQASENWGDNNYGADFIIQNTPNGTNINSRKSSFVAKNDQRIYLTKAHTTYAPYRTNCILNIDLINSVTTGSSLTVGQLIQHANTGSGSILIGAGTTDEFAIFHYGASLSTFNIAGSNFPAPTTTYFYGNSTATSPFYFGASKHAFAVGQTGTNPSMLLDSVGLKLGTVADVATSGNSRLHVNGSLSLSYIAKTANYTATINDYLIDCTSGTFTVTLPTAIGITGRVYEIVNSGLGTITVATASSQTFTNVTSTPTTLTLATALGKSIKVMSNGANWIQLN